MTAINFSEMSIAQLKSAARELNAKIEGDRRLRATWIRACELAQAALEATAKSVDEFTGYPIAASVAKTGEAIAESYGIVHQQFVIPTEKAIALCWDTATGERAMRMYLNGAIALMRFCFACYRAGIAFRDWTNALVEECQQEEEIPVAAIACEKIERVAKAAIVRLECQIWAWDEAYQARVEWVKQEARSVFSLAEWVALLIV